jgi:hypothetical protein
MTKLRMLLTLGMLMGGMILACDDDEEPSSEAEPSPSGEFQTLRVPDDYETIQAAVDAAGPGDLILIAPGVYTEAVDVTTNNLTIRGLDRNEVILDGEFTLDNGIRVLEADGVAIENVTARNYKTNGFYWTGVTGYRGSYLTAYRNGEYGIYAFGSVEGQFDHSYASGSPDAGFYIGSCYPCNALVTDVVAEYNGFGYSGTNAGGNLLIVNSTFRFNRAGIAPNSGSYQTCYPERETTIVGNIVHSNSQADSPGVALALIATGNGIVVAGGVNNTIERNLVFDHALGGISLVGIPEENASAGPPPEEELLQPCVDGGVYSAPAASGSGETVVWQVFGNRVRDNVVEDSGVADLVVASIGVDLALLGNCFAGNQFATSAPLNLEQLAPCEGEGSGDWTDGALDLLLLFSAPSPPPGDFQTTPLPPEQPSMPDASTAPARPATDVPEAIDLDALSVPARPSP